MDKVKKLEPSKIRMSKSKVYLRIVLGTFLLSISSYYLIFATEIYTPGLGGVVNGITYVTMDILNQFDKLGENFEYQFKAIFYWTLYFIANIPIIYLTIKWYSKRFFKLSIMQLIIALCFTAFLSLVPGFRNWTLMENITGDARKVAILFLAALGGLIYGIGVGMVYRVGACTMGFDPIARYLSREKGKNIGPVLFWFSAVTSTIFILVRFFTNDETFDWYGSESNQLTWESFVWNTILNPSFIGSWIFAGVYSFTTGFMYSSDKKYQVIVTSKKVADISNYFIKENYHRGHTMYLVEGGYSKKQSYNFQMIINNEELYDVVSKIAAIDDESFISVNELKRVYDVRTWNPITDEDKEKQRQDNLKKEKKVKQKVKDNKKIPAPKNPKDNDK